MQYQVTVQGKSVKTFTSDNGYDLSSIHNEVRSAIAAGNVSVDNSKPLNIVVSKK